MSNLSKQIANALQGMDPNAARSYLDDLRRDVLRAADQDAIDQAARDKELSETSTDDLTASLVSTPLSKEQERREIKAALKAKQNAAFSESQVTTQTKSDFLETEYKRRVLVEEAASLQGLPSRTTSGHPSAARIRLTEIGKELKAMPAPPDRVVEDPKPDAEKVS